MRFTITIACEVQRWQAAIVTGLAACATSIGAYTTGCHSDHGYLAFKQHLGHLWRALSLEIFAADC